MAAAAYTCLLISSGLFNFVMTHYGSWAHINRLLVDTGIAMVVTALFFFFLLPLSPSSLTASPV